MTSAEEPEDQEERQVVCSGCLQVFPESLVHVIPHFNDSVAAYVTTYRCGECWNRRWRKRGRGSQRRKTRLKSCRRRVFFNGMACISTSSCGATRLPTFKRYCSD